MACLDRAVGPTHVTGIYWDCYETTINLYDIFLTIGIHGLMGSALHLYPAISPKQCEIWLIECYTMPVLQGLICSITRPVDTLNLNMIWISVTYLLSRTVLAKHFCSWSLSQPLIYSQNSQYTYDIVDRRMPNISINSEVDYPIWLMPTIIPLFKLQ